MNKTLLKQVAGIAILVATTAAFIHYFSNHPEVGRQLSSVETSLFITVLALYVLSIASLAAVTLATLRLCTIRLLPKESMLLTAYSSVINFFGPLQSGPAFRAVYLKARHNVNLKKYAAATVLYYVFYGVFSSIMLLAGLLEWLTLPALMLGAVLIAAAARSGYFKERLQAIDLKGWAFLGLATLSQVAAVLMIYYIELTSIDRHISFFQAVVYTGAANLSLFVSITPGAIGFRESFLLFSQSLHQVSAATIVTASILDRAIYIFLLILLGIFILASHAKQRLAVTNSSPKQ